MEPEAKRRKVDGSGRDWRGGRGRGGRGRAGGRGGGRGRGERGGGRDKWEPNDTAKNPQTPSTMKSVSRMPVIRATVPLPNDILPTEEEMGIIEYLDKTGRTPFRVCFKQRYTDFMVREVTHDGKIIRLTDSTHLPEYDLKELEEKNKVYDEEEGVLIFSQLLGADQAQVLGKYAKLEAGDPERQNRLVIAIPDEDKDKRTQFHNNLKKYYPNLRSETKVTGEERKLEVFHPGKRQKERQWNTWGKDKPDFLVFTLYKENKETTAVLELIARTIKVKSSIFDVAGTKDKRAVTTQRVTAYKLPAQKLIDASKKLQGVKMGDYDYVPEALKLGDLKGNHFAIVLRYVDADEATIIAACEGVKKMGFVNYFGTQRFGTGTISTHSVGKELLLSKWPEAIDLILRPRSFEKPDSLKARMHWAETGDIDSSLDLFPRHHVIERKLLIAMKAHGKTLNAFSALPTNLRLMYVHAYQSYIWNMAASKRVAMRMWVRLRNAYRYLEDVLKPIIGDVVLDIEGKAINLTQDNIGQYTIHDVVLPLPGHSIVYPKNEIFDYMKEIMAKDALDIETMERKQFLFSLPGSYRNLIERPENFSYEIKKFKEYFEQLAPTDLDGKPLPATDGPHTSVVVEFSLGSGSYATMMIREITKNSTSQKAQREVQEQLEKEGIVPPSKENALATLEESEVPVTKDEEEAKVVVVGEETGGGAEGGTEEAGEAAEDTDGGAENMDTEDKN